MDTSRDGAFIETETHRTTSEGTVQVTIPGLPQFIGVARQAVDALGEQIHLSLDDRMAVRLAVGEACNNAVFHAPTLPKKTGDPISRVIVACRVSPEALEIDITNSGNDFHPSRRSHRMPEVFAEHGRGMALMETLMDSVEYLSEKGKTIVRMRKLRDSAGRQALTADC